MAGLILLEPLRFGFITQPTKRRLRLQFISETIAAGRVAEFFHAAAFELSAPCGFHFRFSHPDLSCPLRPNRRLLPHRTPRLQQLKLTFYTGF